MEEEVNKFLDINKPMLVVDNIGYPVLDFNGKRISGKSSPKEKNEMLESIREAGPAVFDKMMEKMEKEQRQMLLDHMKSAYESLKKEPQTVLNNVLRGPAPAMFANQLAMEIGLFFIFMNKKTAEDIDAVIKKSLYQKANCLDLVKEVIRYLETGCVVNFSVKVDQ